MVTVSLNLAVAPSGPVAVTYWNPLLKAWEPVANVSVHGSTVTFETSHFTTYAVTPASDVSPVQRLAGSTRIGTAIQAAEAAYPDGAQAVILANAGTGEPSPDALSASGLAGAVHAPVLLTTPNTLSAGDLSAITDLGAKTVYVIGGPAAISSAVVTALQQAGLTVVRSFEGANRFDTALLVDAYLYQHHLTQSKTVFVANGATMIDALSASPVIYQQADPLVLVNTGQTSLPASAGVWLKVAGIKNVVVVGGPVAVKPSIVTQLGGMVGASSVLRLSGATRNGTATAVDAHYFPKPEAVVVSANGGQGGSFVDALSASAFASMNDLPIVLTNPSSLPKSTIAYLNGRTALHDVWVMGGTQAVYPGVSSALQKFVSTP
jgi:putative cell wall-binding protein